MTITDKHIRLLQASPNDFDTIKDLLTQAELYTTSVTPEGATYWIAQLDGQPAGCIGLEHGEGISLIRSAVVIPEARSQGLGRALVQSALAQASLRGDHTVYLFSTGAGDYWKRYGFMPVAASELAAALPNVPQVKSGLERGWIHDELAWKLDLHQQEGQQ